ncbi:hypothetical protein TsFJ059_001627 [Trichoderma semiorbis]|uniref:BRCT domain-containing protein n=2 Tax=Trichoderma semiorbis TaxID=1491008 RepID=A0A9P8KYI6_9HYPO|nr:hypothetical protein TsFJ059_001627 [Trichoderma semiorbis]
MTRSRPLTRAEQLVLEENAESQDSQAILDALNAEFRAATYHEPLALQPQTGIESEGVAGGVEDDDAEAETGDLAISSPRQAAHRQDGSKKQRQLTPHGSVATPHGDVNNLTGTIHRVGREDPRTHQPTSRPGSREQDLDDAVIAASSPFGRNAHSPSSPHNHDTSNQSDEPPAVPIGAGRPQARRMDTSQQTPTQLNVERDYGQFYEPPRSSPPPDTLRSHDERERTLQADDTGAVNFGNLSPGVRPSSQVSEDAGFENTRGEWRVPDLTSQQRSSHGYTPLKPGPLLPETPMPPKNPFAVQHNANAGVPFAGTQLFEQTPVVTSAIKLHSPTSSRPSPNILPDAISLNIIETSPLRNRDNVSSPTVVHTSSPSRPNIITTNTKKLRVSPIQEEALDGDQDAQDDMIPESPTAQPLRPYGNRQPQAHYEPMKKSQERKAVVDVPQAIDSDSDDTSKRARHKKRMEKIRRQAAEEMGRVRVQIPSRRDLSESRNRKRRKLSSGGEEEVLSTKNASSGQTELANTGNELLHSSRKTSSLPEQSLSAGSTKATPRDAIVGDGGKRVAAIRPGKSKEAASEEMIPATSPVRSLSAGAQRDPPVASEPELPPLIENEVRGKEAHNELHTSSLPPPRRHAQRIYGRQAQSRRRQRIVTSSEPNERASAEPDSEAQKGVEIPSDAPAVPTRSAVTRRLAKQGEPLQTSNTESEPPKSSPPSLRSAATVATSLRNQMRERSPLTPVHRRAVDPGAHTSSSLTALSTPVISEKNTPDTQASPVFDQPKSTDSIPSPAQGRKTRARNPGRESSEKTPQQAVKPTKTSMRSTRLEPSSTDELQQSPPSSAVELGISSLRSSRVFKQSIGSTFRGRRLFEGMVFAISMSPDKGNQKTRANLETKIKQAGGLILEPGFEELFEPSTVMSTYDVPVAEDGEALSLSKPSLSYGFTALIADSHSRKVKYMQALALGLPCLAYQWVITCLNKGALIDWEPYLLAAGSSAVLGNAVRSRCLRRYDAGDVRLAEMVEQRPRLLAGEKLLAIVDESRTRNEGKKKKSDVEKKPYMFLAQALGPSISWVSTIQQARELLEAHDKAGKPYTWLYMDESIGTVESVLTISGPTGKKRRRSQGPLATRNVRVLCDELMIQSLILGRMAEEDEMDYAGEKN